jgi:hypothetical protein
MYILEVGVILNGLSIINKAYDKKFSIDKDIRNGLLSAIMNMTKYVLSEHVQHFSFGEYKLIVTSQRIEKKGKNSKKAGSESLKSDLIIYIIGDRSIKTSIVQDLLKEINDKFIAMFPRLAEKQVADLIKYREFLPVFDEILLDLKDSPEKRFEGIF